MAVPIIQIPGNIKQQFLPFVLNPESRLHQVAGSSPDLKKGNPSPQYFTYRAKSGSYPSGIANLRFYPSSMDNIMVNDDISFKLLYEMDGKNQMTNKPLTIQSILDHIPAVQIREFLPDTRLDQCINLITDLFSNMAKLFTGDKKSGDSNAKTNKAEKNDKEEEDNLFLKITSAAWYTMRYFIGATDPDFYDDIGRMPGLPFSSYNQKIYESFKMFGQPEKSPGYFVMTFPYTLYYALQSCVTTGVYEVPALDSDKRILASGGGMKGWGDGSDFMSSGGFRISGLLNKIPLIGSLANMILGNVGVNYMPWWNAESGSKTIEPVINLKFDLFNDSYDAAMNNFIFVNTIVPNNKWIQYNMFQHSSHLYDVKIEGLNRLFACSGDFNVTYEGVLRDPPYKFIKDLVRLHANKNMSGEFKNNIINNKLIKIPDVYRVSLQFQSLLPANFNNFIFNYAENASHMTKYKDHIYDESAVAMALPTAVSRFGKRITAFWNAENAKNDSSAREKAANNAVGLKD